MTERLPIKLFSLLEFPIIGLLVLSVIPGCGTLDRLSIQKIKSIEYNAFNLQPAHDPYHLRFDIIRQSEVSNILDSVKNEEPLPYHPLGFDLGNSLFFDLNGNLSLRLDQYLALNPQHFYLMYAWRQHTTKGVYYQWQQDTFFVNRTKIKTPAYRFHLQEHQDTSFYMVHNKIKYWINRQDSTTSMGSRKKVLHTIGTDGFQSYSLNRRKHPKKISQSGNEVFLWTSYKIVLSPDRKNILVQRRGRKNTYTRLTICRDENNTYIFDQRFHGYRLQRDKNNLDIYNNQKFYKRYLVLNQDD